MFTYLPPIPFPPFSPSLISLMVSVDVKHHVYLLRQCHPNKFSLSGLHKKNIALEKLEEAYEQSEKLVGSEQYLTLTTTTTDI